MDLVQRIEPLDHPWRTRDPFLICVHHVDHYPAGDADLGPPAASLRGRSLGNDFAGRDGWNMYHGERIPGFPGHPHRGFETVTIVRSGAIDHSDSLGASARFGAGDVQWLTAGRGVVHAEMFPLLRDDAPNPLELFQIWLNLPRAHKLVEPHFSMLWREAVPTRAIVDEAGRTARVTVVAGAFGDRAAPAPPPRSWAADPRSDLAIWTLALDPQASVTLPPAQPTSLRTLYFFAGDTLRIGARQASTGSAIEVRPDAPLPLTNGAAPAQLLLLQARPLGEPVAQHGPFVMNSAGEIQQAFVDYQRTRFGGWPWPSPAPVHARDAGRFARHPDGRIERP